MDNCIELDNQLCFPLYVCSKEIIRKYKPYLDEIELTYTQYITMLVLWEKKKINVKCLGEILYLDSGTLTPLLKKLEQKGYVKRDKNGKDERNLYISLTSKGEKLKEKAKNIPLKVGSSMCIESSDYHKMKEILQKMIETLKNDE